MKEERVLLLPVEDSEDSQRAFDFMLKNIFREGDEIHLLNVIPRIQFAATMGVPAVDFTPQINREAYESVVQTSETFIVKRFLSRLPEAIETTPIVHIIKVGCFSQIFMVVRNGGKIPANTQVSVPTFSLWLIMLAEAASFLAGCPLLLLQIPSPCRQNTIFYRYVHPTY